MWMHNRRRDYEHRSLFVNVACTSRVRPETVVVLIPMVYCSILPLR